MPIIVLKDKNIRDIIQNAIKKKSRVYRFLLIKGEIREAENVRNQWEALTEIAEIFGIKYNSIMDEDKQVIRNEKNFRIDMKFCLDLLLTSLKLRSPHWYYKNEIIDEVNKIYEYYFS